MVCFEVDPFTKVTSMSAALTAVIKDLEDQRQKLRHTNKDAPEYITWGENVFKNGRQRGTQSLRSWAEIKNAAAEQVRIESDSSTGEIWTYTLRRVNKGFVSEALNSGALNCEALNSKVFNFEES